MAKTIEQVLDLAKETELVDIRFVDLPGTWQHFTIPTHRLTQHERNLLVPHAGVFYGYHRSAFLRTPRPDSQVVAEVQATVLLGRLPEETAHEVLDARRTLGSILLEAGAAREFLSVSHGGRWDAGGNPIAFRSSFMFFLHGRPVAIVREDVHESTVTLRKKVHNG